MNRRNSQVLYSAVALLALAIAAGAAAQVTVPPKSDRVGTPGQLQLPRRPAVLDIVSIGSPHELSARANAPYDVTFTVAVRNTGETTGAYSLAATLAPGSTAEPRSDGLRVAPGATNSTPFRIQAQMANTYIKGERLPIVIRLVGSDGREIDRHAVSVPFLPPFRSDEATNPAGSVPGEVTANPNLSMERVAVGPTMSRERGVRIGTRDGRAVSEIALANLRITASLRNAGPRWGYPARVNFTIHEGTPDTGLRALGSRTGCRIELPGNIGLETREVQCLLEPAGIVQPGIWHTVHTSLLSAADSDLTDNAKYVVFMYGHDGRLVSQHEQSAPATQLVPVRAPRVSER